MTAECHNCGTAIADDDLTYRVLYGRLEDAAVGNISEKLAGRAGEELDPGARDRYWCFDCHKQERQADRAAHYRYESATTLWNVLEAADGALVADSKAITVGGRGWFRVVDGMTQARHSVTVRGDEDDDWDIGFETKPTQDFDDADFIDLFGGAADDRRLALLRPVDETPFVAGQNETLDGFDAGREAESR